MTQKPEYIDFFLDGIDTDPVQYKPYSPHFTPTAAVVVRVPIDPDLILEVDEGCTDGAIIIGEQGFVSLVVRLAGMVAKAHREFQASQQDEDDPSVRRVRITKP